MTSNFPVSYLPYVPSAVLKITGEDALAFLQGQFTQELRFPAGRLCAYGLWLNQKGKVVADSFALRDGDAWWLVNLDSAAATLRERLEAYIIADDVVIEDETANWSGLLVAGEGATALLEAQGVQVPPADEWAPCEDAMIFRGRRGNVDAWEWLVPAGQPLPAAVLRAGMPQADSAALEQRRIEAVIPKIPTELGPTDLPNEAGLEREAISYSKGCYLGQEVMARLKTMGQVRRRLFAVRGTGGVPSCPVPLYLAQKKVGELRSAIPVGAENAFIGLAMLSLIGRDGHEPLSVGENAAARVHVILPAS